MTFILWASDQVILITWGQVWRSYAHYGCTVLQNFLVHALRLSWSFSLNFVYLHNILLVKYIINNSLLEFSWRAYYAPLCIKTDIMRCFRILALRVVAQHLLQNRLMDVYETWWGLSANGPAHTWRYFGHIGPGADPGLDKNRLWDSPS